MSKSTEETSPVKAAPGVVPSKTGAIDPADPDKQGTKKGDTKSNAIQEQLDEKKKDGTDKSQEPEDVTGDRMIPIFRVQVGELLFSSEGGDFLTGPGFEPYIKNGSYQHNELFCVINDPDDAIRVKLIKAGKVKAEVGFIDGPKHTVFTGEVYEAGRMPPNGTVLVAIDPSYKLANQVGSAVADTSSSAVAGGSGSDANFERIIKFVQEFEGDGSAGPADLGGKTRFGVTESLWTSLGKPEPQTKEAAAAIFKEIYWDGGPKCGQYQDPVAAVCFDTSVNFGPHGNPPKSNGWKSLSAGLDLTGNPVSAALSVCDRRIAHRHAMVAKNGSQKAFLQGWLRRDNALKELAQKIAAESPPKPATGATGKEGQAGDAKPDDDGTKPEDTATGDGSQTAEQKAQAEALKQAQQASEERNEGKKNTTRTEQVASGSGLKTSDRSVTDTGGAGRVQQEESALASATKEAQTKGDQVAVRGDTIEQTSPGNEEDTGVSINYGTETDLFIGNPQFIKRSGMQLKSGFGALSVQGWSTNGKTAVGATVVTPGETPTGPSGPITVPEWGQVKRDDPIYDGSHYTWGDATKNMSRVPDSQDTMKGIVIAAQMMQELCIKFNEGKKLNQTSWYRTPAANAGAGGATKSQHMVGKAVDINDAKKQVIKETLEKEGWHKNPGGGGLGWSPGSFVHVDKGNPRGIWGYP